MQVVSSLLNGRMAGEGNLLRHLAQLSYRLQYIQDPLSDFDFTLTSLSAELRDGLRLCKLADVLTGGITQHISAQYTCSPSAVKLETWRMQCYNHVSCVHGKSTCRLS